MAGIGLDRICKIEGNMLRSVILGQVLKIGVPQGSILGPVLLILYINDMCNSSASLKFIHFADDTSVFLKNENLYILCAVANHELSKLDAWLISDRLSLNVGKSSVMHVY